jgi:hypothetical protein
MCDVNDAKRHLRETSPAKKDNWAIWPQDVELHILRRPSHFNIREMKKEKKKKKKKEFIIFITIVRAWNIFFFQKKKAVHNLQPSGRVLPVGCA